MLERRRDRLHYMLRASLPLVTIGYLYWTDPIFAEATRGGAGFWVEIGIMLGVTFLCSVFGTHMINTLRNEAFEARQLGQYRLKQRLGAGGMGEVYLAEHQLLKRPCAIKLIRPEQAGDPQDAGPVRARGAGDRHGCRTGTPSRSTTTAAPTTARSIT